MPWWSRPTRSGWVASTRNGGMVIPELKYGPRALSRRYGPLGGELVDAVLDACDLVEEHDLDHAHRLCV